MPEITPRELGEEAKALYDEHKSAEDQVYIQTEAFEHDLKKARSTHENAMNQYAAVRADTTLDIKERAEKNSGIEAYETKDLFQLGRQAIYQAESLDAADATLSKAADHFKENEAAYHDLAVLDAAMDGVHINVQQPKETEERVDVKHG